MRHAGSSLENSQAPCPLHALDKQVPLASLHPQAPAEIVYFTEGCRRDIHAWSSSRQESPQGREHGNTAVAALLVSTRSIMLITHTITTSAGRFCCQTNLTVSTGTHDSPASDDKGNAQRCNAASHCSEAVYKAKPKYNRAGTEWMSHLDAPVHACCGEVLAVPVESSRAYHVGLVGQVAVVERGLDLHQ